MILPEIDSPVPSKTVGAFTMSASDGKGKSSSRYAITFL